MRPSTPGVDTWSMTNHESPPSDQNGQQPATPDLLAEAEALLPEIIGIRRHLHRRPEVGLELPETQATAAGALRGLGLEPVLGRAVGSVVAVIAGERPGPTVLLRADMDGLPLTEATGLEFASEIPDRMHACGHDTHVAMLLGAARLLRGHHRELAGHVVLMLQPGEEGYHGARSMLDEGLLEPPGIEPVSSAFAIHISTRYASGTVHLRPGPLLASGDVIHLTVRGRGGHASTPHLALDPIAVAAEIVLGLQTAVTRRVDVFDPAVVTITRIEGGTTNNIIPESVHLEGTIRTVSAATRAFMREEVRRVVEGIAATRGADAELELEPGYPVTVNDPRSVGRVRELAEGLLGPERVSMLPAPIMGAEDFSYVLERVPGSMAFLGARPPGQDEATAPMNHSNRVVFDEPAMAVGTALYAAVALRGPGA
jgi:amidohydrolase